MLGALPVALPGPYPLNQVVVFLSVCVVLWCEEPFRAGLLRDLEAAGVQRVELVPSAEALVSAVVRHAPKLVVVRQAVPTDALVQAATALQEQVPVPVLAFVEQADAASTERAVAAAVHTWVVGAYAPERLPALMHLAECRQRHEQALRDALRDVTERFEERKAVERAKGLLMSARAVSDEEAFHILRTASMHSNQRLGQVAQHIIQSARSAEAVNRSGQQRMLSQRLVKHWLLRLAGVQVARHTALQAESAQRVDDNLKLLAKQIVEPQALTALAPVVGSWKALKKLLKAAPAPSLLAEVDAWAERLLQDAEHLTTLLERSGSQAPLRMLNTAGRQRMLSQRFAKASLLGVLQEGERQQDALVQAEAARQSFDEGMAFLNALPLSTADIRQTLDAATQGWQSLQAGAHQVRHPSGRDRLLRMESLAGASETLLDDFERLAGQYEHSMQMLMG